MPLSVGLVGFGLAGRVLHAPLIHASGMQIVGVVTRQAEAVRALLPTARPVPDLGALLSLPRLDLVVIATPNDLHEPQALEALAAGKHVVVDKPLALTAAGVERLMRAAAESSVMLTAFHNRRWDADFLAVRTLVDGAALGAVHGFEARWNRYRPKVPDRWRESAAHGGGVLLDLGTHLIDQALALFGMPDWLQADVYSQRAGATVDDAFDLRMGKGRMRIMLGASSLAADPGPRYQLAGELGSYSSTALDPQEDQLRAGMAPTDAAFGCVATAEAGRLCIAATGVHAGVPAVRGRWVDFYAAVRSGIEAQSPPPVAAAQVRQVLQLVEAARQSSQRGARVWLESGAGV